MNYKEILSTTLKAKMKRNPSFSMRSFARMLDCSPSYLSEVISGKKTFSLPFANSVLTKLQLDERSEKDFMDSVHAELAKVKKVKSSNDDDYFEITPEAFAKINHWQYFAILTVINLDNYNINHLEELAKKFSLETPKLQAMIDELLELNFLSLDGETLRTGQKKTQVRGEIPKSSLRSFQKEILERAILSLDKFGVEERSITSNIFPCSKEDVETIKEEIKKFRRKLAKKFQRKKNKHAYALNISLIPLEDS